MLNVAEMKMPHFNHSINISIRNRICKKKLVADNRMDEMLFSVSHSVVSATKTARWQICAGFMAEYKFYFS